MTKRDTLVWIASFMMLILLVGLVAYLTFIPVPAENKELIITVLGVLLGGGAAAMPNLFGDKDGETNKLRDRVRTLEAQMALQKAEHDVLIARLVSQADTLKEQYDSIVGMLIDRHVVKAEGLALEVVK